MLLIIKNTFSFQIDFFQMPVNTLRRYKRHYKLQTRPGLNKAQLADVSQVILTANIFLGRHSLVPCQFCKFGTEQGCPEIS